MKHENIPAIAALQREIYTHMKNQGFHDKDSKRNLSVTVDVGMTNINGEISELWEAARKGQLDSPCDKQCNLTCGEEECADIVIRVLDFCGVLELNVYNVLFAANEIVTNCALEFDKDKDDITDHLGVVCNLLHHCTSTVSDTYSDATKYTLNHMRRTTEHKFAQIVAATTLLSLDLRYDLWAAIQTKCAYNLTRPHRHGKLA